MTCSDTVQLYPGFFLEFLNGEAVGDDDFKWRDSYPAHFNYHRRPGYRVSFQLVLNAAYSCPSGVDCMHWLLKQSQIQYQHCRKCKTKTSDEHKHCTMQPFDTAFGRQARLLNGGWDGAPP